MYGSRLEHIILIICGTAVSFLIAGIFWVVSAQNVNNIAPRDFWIDSTSNSIYFIQADSQTVERIDLATQKTVSSANISSPFPLGSVFLDETNRWLVFIAHGLTRDGLIFILPKDKLTGEDRADSTFSSPLRSGLPLIAQKGRKIYLAGTMSKQIRVFSVETEPKELTPISLSDIPSAVKADPVKGAIYVLHRNANQVSVVDTKTDKVINSFSVGDQSVSLTVDPQNNRIFVSASVEGAVYVFNRTTYQLEKKIKVGNLPGFTVFLSRIEKVFVANNADGTLSVISKDLAARTIDLQSPASLQSAPYLLSIDATRNRVYAVNLLTGILFSVDGQKDAVLHQTRVGADPTIVQINESSGLLYLISRARQALIEVDPESFDITQLPKDQQAYPSTLWFNRPQSIIGDETTGLIYVTNLGDASIAVIDSNTNKPTKKIATGAVSEVIVLNKANKYLYTSNREESSVSAIDTNTGQIIKIPVGKLPRSLYARSDRNKVYVANFGGRSISVIDGSSNRVVNTISVDLAPLSISASRNKLFVSNSGADTVTVIDLETERIEKNVKVGGNPGWIIHFSPLKEMYVAVEGNRNIAVLDAETGNLKDTIQLNFTPYRALAFRDSDTLYVVHRGEPTITKVDLKTKKVVGEEMIPFFGYLDLNYNMFWINPETGLAYFTSRPNNFVQVVQGGIENPRLLATIRADGNVIYAGLQPETSPFDKKSVFVSAALILLLIFLVFAVRYFLRRLKATPPSPPSYE